MPENLTVHLSLVCVCVCVYLCPTWSVWALQRGSADNRGPAPRQAPLECGCRQPRWYSCPVALSIHSLMPCCPEAPGARSPTWSEGTHSLPFTDYLAFYFWGVTERMIWRLGVKMLSHLKAKLFHFFCDWKEIMIHCKGNFSTIFLFLWIHTFDSGKKINYFPFNRQQPNKLTNTAYAYTRFLSPEMFKTTGTLPANLMKLTDV